MNHDDSRVVDVIWVTFLTEGRTTAKKLSVGAASWDFNSVTSAYEWEDNIKMDLQEVVCGGMKWMELTQDRERLRYWTFGFHNMRGISCIAENQLASQEGVSKYSFNYTQRALISVHMLIWTFFFVFMWGTHSWICPSIVGTACIFTITSLLSGCESYAYSGFSA